MKVGVYGGTFDPIHFGHLNLAIEIMEAHHLDEVWFCPAQISPHKQKMTPTPVHHRLAMLELALCDIPNFKVLDIETKRQGPSFTIDTLRELIAIENQYSNQKEFYLILGDDSLPEFSRWHLPEEIIKLVPLLIGRRSSQCQSLEFKGNPAICEAIRNGLTPTRLMEISGTEIRQRLQQGKYVGHLLPAKVMDYIYKHHLYSIPASKI